MVNAVKLKVYGWQAHRSECKVVHSQTREIVAATSKTEVARIVGVKSPSYLWNLGETGNTAEVAIAMADPGVVFWKPIDAPAGDFTRSEGQTCAAVPPASLQSDTTS